MTDERVTAPVDEPPPGLVKCVELRVVEPSGRSFERRSSTERVSVGSDSTNDVVIEDATASRFHCELIVQPDGLRVRDLGSRNGTLCRGIAIQDAVLREATSLRLGSTLVDVVVRGMTKPARVSPRYRFGPLFGRSIAMRQVFAQLEAAAGSESTVLVEGESGTGKEGAAVGLHEASARAGGPFIVVDCGALPPSLLESELFGHEAGAFTGAVRGRIGAFEEAQGGTLFLDEIGELPLELQPKLLRAIEARSVRRLGSNRTTSLDVRLVAATNRDLRRQVNAGRFRSDLYFRLAVLTVRIPPLRERLEDLPMIVEQLLARLGASADAARPLLAPAHLASLAGHPFQGNVRELRNYLERSLVFGEGEIGPSPDAIPVEVGRRQAADAWEREAVAQALRRTGGHVEEAASLLGVGRSHAYRLVKKHRLA